MASMASSPELLRLATTLRHTSSSYTIRASTSRIFTRNATVIKRPKRPYTFTQLVVLSDGSSFLQRTTNPAPLYQCTKDTRNSAIWNPSLERLKNVEEDEAGRLRAFRARYGRGWDADAAIAENEETGEAPAAGQEQQGDGDFFELISSYAQKNSPAKQKTQDSGAKQEAGKKR